MKQMWQVFQMTRRYDPSAQWLMLLGFLCPCLVGLGLALWLGEGNGFTIALWIVAGVLAGLLIALVILGRRAERAAYSQIDGQPGAVGAVLRSGLRGGWVGNEMPVAVNGKTQDAVYRAGRPRRRRAHQRGPGLAHQADARRREAQGRPRPAERARSRPSRSVTTRARSSCTASPRRCARPSARSPSPRCSRCRTASTRSRRRCPSPEGHRPHEGAAAARQDALTRSTRRRHPFARRMPHAAAQARISTVSGDLVVEAALVGVPDERGHHDDEQQRAHERPPEADPAAGQADDAHAAEAVADAAADRRDEQDLHEREDPRVIHECSRRAVGPRRAVRSRSRSPSRSRSRRCAGRRGPRIRRPAREAQPLPRPAARLEVAEGRGSASGIRRVYRPGPSRNMAETFASRSGNAVPIASP